MKILNSTRSKSQGHLYRWAFLLIVFVTSISLNAQPDGIKIAQPRVFGNSFKKNLYQAELTVMKHVVSGMIFVKKTDKTYRAVFMSEIGLKYFDIEIGQTGEGDYTIHYMMEMLNLKAILEFVETAFRMLTLTFGDIKKEDSFSYDGSGNTVHSMKTHHGKFRFDYQPNSGYISYMIHKRLLKKKLTIELSNYGYLAPATINIDQKKIQLILKQIEN